MRTSAEIVVVGAGIVGCSAAHHLTRLGCADVVVVDQGPLFRTGGSTSHAPGIIFQTNGSRMMTAFAQETLRLLADLDLDGAPVLKRVGSLEVATTPERHADLKRKLGWAKSWGVEAALLTSAETAALLPLLDPARIRSAYHVPADGVVDGVAASEALARRATAAGAEFVGHTTVTGFETERGRLRAVLTDRGRIAAERVLICAGIWGPRVGKLAGVPIPLTPIEHQLAWTTPLPELAGETREIVHPVLRHQDRDLYFRQRRDCYAVGSYGHEPRLVSADAIPAHADAGPMPSIRPFTPEDLAPAWAEAVELLPALKRVGVAEGLNGMFSFTPDGYPLLGESPDVRGCWVAEAIWVTHSGGAARAVAEWMTQGRPATDVHEADLNRFEPHAAAPAYVRERGAQQYREVYDVIHPLQPMARPRPLRVGPFFAAQRDLGAVFFEGKGWEQPRWYAANERLLERYPAPPREGWAAQWWSPVAVAEHLATREGVALFDMSPLAKAEVSGPGALAFLERTLSNRIDRPVGRVTYALMLDEGGRILSDLTVARLGPDRFQIGCNGPQDLARFRLLAPEDGSVAVRDVTGALACLGVWGPAARSVLARLTEDDLCDAAFPYFAARRIAVGDVPATALRVSYVGELGWELYVSPEYGARLWRLLWEAGQPEGIVAAGRAAFDSLRIEKGYRLWGADIRPDVNPYEAGLGFAVKLDKGDFVGRDALEAIERVGPTRTLCCLTLEDPNAVVMGKEPILAGERVLGFVASAAYGPSVGASIAYGALPSECAEPGRAVEIEYFGERLPARVATDPLWDPRGERLRG